MAINFFSLSSLHLDFFVFVSVSPRCTFYSCCCIRFDSFAPPQGKKLIVVELYTKRNKYLKKKNARLWHKLAITSASVSFQYKSSCCACVYVCMGLCVCVFSYVCLRCHSLNAPFCRVAIGLLSAID